MPQPINRIVTNPHVILDTNAIKDKPDFANLVCQIFATWARVEQELSIILVRVLGADAAPAIAMYSTLTAQHLQLGALLAAAKAVLSLEDFNIFKAAISVAESAQTPRNHLAHWPWGRCKQRPDLLALANPKMLKERDFRVIKRIHTAEDAFSIHPTEIANLNLFEDSEILAYTKADLERALRDVIEAYDVLSFLLIYIDPKVDEVIFRHFGDNLKPMTTDEISGATVATTLVCFLLLHTRLRMRLRIRRSARPHFEGRANRDFGRPRAVTITGAMAHARYRRGFSLARTGQAPRALPS